MCDGERGPVCRVLILTDSEGNLLDRVPMCLDCARENPAADGPDRLNW